MATEYYFSAADLLNAQGEISGIWGSASVVADPLEARGEISGVFISSMPWPAVLEATAEIYTDLAVFEEKAYNNWVAWSKIGTADFTLDRTNDAGRRPMDWNGWVYSVKGMDKNVIVYGAGGITLMYPVSEPFPTFGFKSLWPQGLLAKNLVCGNDQVHYFVDASGSLCSLTSQGVKALGYREDLRSLATHGKAPTMHYDELNHLVYICDGTIGFTYSENGLGGGPINVTGVQAYGAEPLVVAPVSLTTPDFEMLTNIITCGLVEVKTLQKITIATADPASFWFAVDYRTDIRKDFITTAWKQFEPTGEGWINLSFMEMRLRVKSTAIDAQIDDITLLYRAPGVLLAREVVK